MDISRGWLHRVLGFQASEGILGKAGKVHVSPMFTSWTSLQVRTVVEARWPTLCKDGHANQLKTATGQTRPVAVP